MDCPCGSGEQLDDCCGPYIDGDEAAPTAEALMRSRYTAYALGEVDYVIETHVPEARKELDAAATRRWAEDAEWFGLQILDVVGGGEEDDEGEVEFIASYEDSEKAHAHHERSHFQRIDGRWYFREGEVKKPESVVREGPKVGRNDPCPCGSGKKHKKCCARPQARPDRG